MRSCAAWFAELRPDPPSEMPLGVAFAALTKSANARDYPAIARRAKREGAVVYWGDETGISNHLRKRRRIRSENRRAAGHGLQHDQAESLGQAGEHVVGLGDEADPHLDQGVGALGQGPIAERAQAGADGAELHALPSAALVHDVHRRVRSS